MIPRDPSHNGGDAPALPRELFLASAGTGKTYTLSGRIIALLAAGAPPETLLASTFTRKAAGEILNRVLTRLARAGLSAKQAAELAASIRAPGVDLPTDETPEMFLALLHSLVRNLHRLNIGTLDSFFIRVARGFSPDLGLPPAWAITDEPGARAMEAEALQNVLAGADRGELVEVIRMAMRGDWGRGVHSRLLDQLRKLRGLLHQLETGPDGAAWGPSIPAPGSVSAAEWQAVASELANAPVPETQTGKPDSRFLKAVASAAEGLLEGKWEEFCSKGLAASLLRGETTYYKKEIPDGLISALQRGLDLAAAEAAWITSRQALALARLAGDFDARLTEIQRAQGSLRFEDVTFVLGGVDPLGRRSDIWYRLDQEARHLLLDEFQDTSLAQWGALEPLAEELLSGHLEDRSATVVADPKQSIYGWRGADPLLVARLGNAFPFRERTLEESYRSSPVVLELVNRVFRDLAGNPVWNESDEKRSHAVVWARSFLPHRAAHPDLPGYVRVMAGPREENMARSERPRMMAWAADRVAELAAETPAARIGVLVRQNAAVTRLIMELRRRGVPASEEGASALEDSPAVSTLLALFRLADHPGDSLAAYQVRHSPLALLFPHHEPGRTSWEREVSAEVRRALVSRGYGATINAWVRALGRDGVLSRRDLQRLLQLTELAYRWDDHATLRPADFVRFVQAERMEAPSEARVRVMTVHQAKGLEFDQVVLPELDLPLTRGGSRFGGVYPLRNPSTGEVTRILPGLPAPLRPLLPELAAAARQESGSALRDALGILYVALTRARQALHVFVAEVPETGRLPSTFAGVVLGSLGLDRDPFFTDELLLELGDSGWAKETGLVTPVAVEPGAEPGSRVIPAPGLIRKRTRTRNLPHRAPSSLEVHGEAALRSVLTLERSGAMERGSLIHRWLQELSWVEEWPPATEDLLAQAREVAPGLSPEQALSHLATLNAWLQPGEVRRCLSRESYPLDAEVRNEYPFAVSIGQEFFNGMVDRVVLVREGGKPVQAHVLDYKTDSMGRDDEEALAGRVRTYRPQVEIYRKAISRILRLQEARVKASLIFLAPGRVVEI